MADEREGGHQEQQDGGPVLRVPVDLAGHANQPQQAGSLQQTYESRGLQRTQGARVKTAASSTPSRLVGRTQADQLIWTFMTT